MMSRSLARARALAAVATGVLQPWEFDEGKGIPVPEMSRQL